MYIYDFNFDLSTGLSLLYLHYPLVDYAPVEDNHSVQSQGGFFPFDTVHEKEFPGIMMTTREK